MKTVTIVSGNFSGTKDGRKNNFNGYTATGQRYFIHKRQMDGIKMDTDAKLKFPLYAFVQQRTFDKLDADGNVVEVNGIVRDQATAIFTDRDALIEAKNSDLIIEILAQKALRKEAEDAGLSPEAVNKLADMSL